IAARLGCTFDVVLSSCVASQLCAPLYRVLARRPSEWLALMRAIGSAHLETMVRLARPDGTCVLLGDAFYAPAGANPAPPTWDTLDGGLLRNLRDGVMRLRDPAFLLELLQAAPSDRLTAARLTEPWLWTVEQAVMLV